jgi:hypothetical protein
MYKIIEKCVCGHWFDMHDESGCQDVDHDGQLCMCAYDKFDAELKAYKEQLKELIWILNGLEK